MSIIEKAVERLERPRETVPPLPVVEDRADPIEEIEAIEREADTLVAEVPSAPLEAQDEPSTEPDRPVAPEARVALADALPAEASPASAPAEPAPSPERVAQAERAAPAEVLPVGEPAGVPSVGDVSAIEVENDDPAILADDAQAARTTKSVALDFDRLRSLGVITPDSTESPIAEEHRLIKRPLLMNASLDGNHRIPRGNMILVTSSVPGEGKTFTSINMAMSTAMEYDRTVLLVDTDVYKADISRILGIDEEEGLTDYLMNPERDLSEFLVKTDVPKLTVLPSGMRRANTTELFASESMRRLVAELSERYPDRIVIFDSPPLLATSGAGVLASLVGQVVMVVESVRTSRSAIRESLHMLDDIDYVGVVVNKSRERKRGGYGYGKYGYDSYGHGHRA